MWKDSSLRLQHAVRMETFFLQKIYKRNGDIGQDGKIIVRAPLDADNSDIAKFIREEENWIRESFRELKEKTDKNT